MNAQLLRIIIAGTLALVTTIATVSLAILKTDVPDDLGIVTVACITYLFGVVTNGSGLGRPPSSGEGT